MILCVCVCAWICVCVPHAYRAFRGPLRLELQSLALPCLGWDLDSLSEQQVLLTAESSLHPAHPNINTDFCNGKVFNSSEVQFSNSLFYGLCFWCGFDSSLHSLWSWRFSISPPAQSFIVLYLTFTFMIHFQVIWYKVWVCCDLEGLFFFIWLSGCRAPNTICYRLSPLKRFSPS